MRPAETLAFVSLAWATPLPAQNPGDAAVKALADRAAAACAALDGAAKELCGGDADFTRAAEALARWDALHGARPALARESHEALRNILSDLSYALGERLASATREKLRAKTGLGIDLVIALNDERDAEKMADGERARGEAATRITAIQNLRAKLRERADALEAARPPVREAVNALMDARDLLDRLRTPNTTDAKHWRRKVGDAIERARRTARAESISR